MSKLAFFSGVILGAAGLTAAALWDDKREQAKYSPLLKTPASLNEDQVIKQLNSYYFKAQSLYSQINEIEMKVSDLISTPLELPDDNLLQKAGNWIGGQSTVCLRNWREKELKDLQKKVKSLYARYKGVFERANTLALEKGAGEMDLSEIAFSTKAIAINSSLENDDWNFEISDFADTIRDFIDKSCEIAEKLIDVLEKTKPAETGSEPLAEGASQ